MTLMEQIEEITKLTEDMVKKASELNEASSKLIFKVDNDVEDLDEVLDKVVKDPEKELFQIVYNWGKVGLITDEKCNTFKDLIEDIKRS